MDIDGFLWLSLVPSISVGVGGFDILTNGVVRLNAMKCPCFPVVGGFRGANQRCDLKMSRVTQLISLAAITGMISPGDDELAGPFPRPDSTS